MVTGDQDALQLRSADRAAYLRATQLLRPTEVPLESAIAQFVEATRLLGNHSLVEAVRFYVRRNPVALPKDHDELERVERPSGFWQDRFFGDSLSCDRIYTARGPVPV
jgi:hypothetical protein